MHPIFRSKKVCVSASLVCKKHNYLIKIKRAGNKQFGIMNVKFVPYSSLSSFYYCLVSITVLTDS